MSNAMTMTTRAARAEGAADDAPLPLALDRKTILTRVMPMSERSFARLLSAGKFPPPDLRLSQKQQYWRLETVLAWLDAQQREG